MKVIDLLQRIANGEEVPKKIKWGDFVLEWDERGYHDYKFLGSGNHLLFQGFATSVLSDEIEIIEEDEKIKPFYFSVYQSERMGGREVVEPLEKKINEIIIVINEMREDK